ncbi:hypothetical protein H0H92_003887 [Tricholoma furcatifolium]|nr:hypothetical protein H0H92_003887 [Tricholoma furcatifolium]
MLLIARSFAIVSLFIIATAALPASTVVDREAAVVDWKRAVNIPNVVSDWKREAAPPGSTRDWKRELGNGNDLKREAARDW